MICSRVSAGLRGSGLRATLGSATAKVAASRERGRAGAAGVGVTPCGVTAGGAAASAPSCRRPARPCGGGGAGSRCSAVPRDLCSCLLVADLPGVVPLSFLSRLPSPHLLGNPSVSRPPPHSHQGSGCASELLPACISPISVLVS